MSEKKFIAAPGDEIVITVPPRKRESAVLREPLLPRRGMIRTGGGSDILPRRLQKDGFLNFWDLGQTRNAEGLWITNNFSHQPTIDWHIGDSVVANIAPLPDTLLQSFQNSIVSVGLENFKTTYRKIEKIHAPSFPLRVSGTNGFVHNIGDTDDAWTSDGLRLTAAELIAMSSIETPLLLVNYAGYIVPLVNFRGAEAQFKFTSAFDYDSAAASFTPRGGDNWFLMPRITFRSGLSQETAEIDYHLDLDYRLHQRYFDEPTARSDGETIEAVNRMTAQPPFRAFKTDRGVAPGTVTPAAAFPYQSAAGLTSVRYTASPHNLGIFTDYLNAGALAAIIEQHGNWFYCWRIPV